MEERIFEIFQSHKEELYERFHIESLSIFGSVSRGSASPNSDIDILVRYRSTPGIFEFIRLKQYLETLIGKPVDLVTEGALKKQLKSRILQEAIRVA
jgi:uncharacterized protein